MTLAPSSALQWEVATFNALPDYPSSVPAGINGDQSHFRSNTYHIGISELPNKGGYTNRTWEDQMPAAGSSWHSCATDESMSTNDMIKNWNRHLAVFNDHSDPRRAYLAEYIGWNGVGKAERLDFQANTRTVASDDHRWHRHRAKRRRWYNSMTAAVACISVDKGETKAQYMASIGQAPVTLPKGRDVILVHKTEAGNTTYAMVSAAGWDEIKVPAEDQQFTANSLASATGDSKLMPTDRYNHAKAWWLSNVVKATSVALSPADAEAMADKVAAAVIAADTNPLSAADLDGVKEAVKAALREGTV